MALLPDHVLVDILSQLSWPCQLVPLRLVCYRWKRLIDSSMVLHKNVHISLKRIRGTKLVEVMKQSPKSTINFMIPDLIVTNNNFIQGRVKPGHMDFLMWEITASSLTQVQRLDLTGQNISSLGFLKLITNLVDLDISRCIHLRDFDLGVVEEIHSLRVS